MKPVIYCYHKLVVVWLYCMWATNRHDLTLQKSCVKLDVEEVVQEIKRGGKSSGSYSTRQDALLSTRLALTTRNNLHKELPSPCQQHPISRHYPIVSIANHFHIGSCYHKDYQVETRYPMYCSVGPQNQYWLLLNYYGLPRLVI